MRGRLSDDKWHIASLQFSDFLAERHIDGKTESHYLHSHCLQCAKSDVLSKYGGKVDLRGWHKSPCGAFLRVMQQAVDEEDDIGGSAAEQAH